MESDSEAEQVTLILQGGRAERGIVLSAFDGFVTHFVRALRYHHRTSSTVDVRRPGRPMSDEELATAFRLVELRPGSAIAVLEPAAIDDETTETLTPPPPPLAWRNLTGLIEAIEAEEPIDASVTDELESALRSLGTKPRLVVRVQSPGRKLEQVLDRARIKKIRSRLPQVTARTSVETAVTGILHAIDLEPDRLAIRTPKGVDWPCFYPSDFETDVLSLVGRRVMVRGEVIAEPGRKRALQIIDIREVPEPEQTTLFTEAPVSLESLLVDQGVTRPQGLSRFSDPAWEDNEESNLFLSAVLGELPEDDVRP
ncbi:MAG TPA: hypothetical protein VMR89_08995 [Actinomycetota bacterium]|nr:hypothetical protein [Actinomycetota bacterium]